MSWVNSVCFTPDSRRFVVGGDDGRVTVWDVTPRKLVYALAGHTDGVTGVAVTPDGQRLLSASRDGTGRIWVNPKSYVRLKGHQGALTSVCHLSDRVVTGSLDATAMVWNMANGTALQNLEGHEKGVLAVAGHGTRVITGSMDATARVWDVETGIQLGKLTGHQGYVSAVLASGERYIVTGSTDNTVRVWDARHRLPLEMFKVSAEVTCLGERGNQLYVGCLDGQMHVFQDLVPVTQISNPNILLCMAFAPDGSALASGYDQGITLQKCT